MASITIRPPQLDALLQPQRDAFEDRLLDHIRRRWPAPYQALDQQTLRGTIRQALSVCARYGITTERDVGRYLALMHELSLELDQRPWVRTILGDTTRSGTQRMDVLYCLARVELEQRERP